MYYAQFEAQKHTLNEIRWDIHYDKTVDVEYYYESMDVRGNVLDLDKITGHLSISKEFTTYFEVNRGRNESVSEYIIYGTKVMEIIKTLEDDVITFEYRELSLDRTIYGIDRYYNTGKFIEKIPNGSGFPSNGHSGGSWYIEGKNSNSPLVYNIREGGVYSKIVNENEVTGSVDSRLEIRWIAGNIKSFLHYIQWNTDGDFSDGKWREIRISNYTVIDGNSYHRKAYIPVDSFPEGEEIYLRFMELDSDNNRTYEIGWVTFENLGALSPPKLITPSSNSDINGKTDLLRLSWSFPGEDSDLEIVKTEVNARVRRATGSISGWKKFEVFGDVRVWESKEFTSWVNGIAGIAPSEIEVTLKSWDAYGRVTDLSSRYSFYYSPEEYFMNFTFSGEEGEEDGQRVLYVDRYDYRLQLKFPLSVSGTFHKEVRAFVELKNDTTGEVLHRGTRYLRQGSSSFDIVDKSLLTNYDRSINTKDSYSLIISNPRIDDIINSKSFKFKIVFKPLFPDALSWGIKDEVDRYKFSFLRRAEKRKEEIFRVLRYDYDTGNIYEVGNSEGEDVFDYTPHPKGSHYVVIAELGNGTYSIAGRIDVFNGKMSVDYPEILNLSTGTRTRVRDVVVTDTNQSPLKSLHYMAGRNNRLVEYGTHKDMHLNLSWLVGDIDELHTYLKRFNVQDVLHYRDKEGRHLYLSVDSVNVKESYNPLRWQIDLTAQSVEGLTPHTGVYYDWRGNKKDVFEEVKGGS